MKYETNVDGVIVKPNSGLIPLYDSDSSLFNKEHFPGNYIKHIENVLACHDSVLMLASYHEAVRKMMRTAGIPYLVVYPDRSDKELFIERYKTRGNT